MFYSTIVKRFTANGVEDIHGKKLKFTGNLSCGEGDIVWTDGNVILGHRPIRGGYVFPQQGGIPVAADDGTASASGYFKKSGRFVDKQIANDDWITNSKRYFGHGERTVNGKKVIDAEIGEKGETLIATEGLYHKNKQITFNNHLYAWHFSIPYGAADSSDDTITIPYSVLDEVQYTTGQAVTIGSDADDEDYDLAFYKDSTKINSVNLRQYADLAEDAALKIKDTIMERSEIAAGAVNCTRQPAPPDDFIASTYARVAALNIQPTGDWDALIVTSSYGYCFPYRSYDASLFLGSFPNGEDKVANKYLKTCISFLEEVLENIGKSTFNLDVEVLGNDVYSVTKAAYYIPRVRFQYYLWYTVMFYSFVVVKVHNGKVVDTIRSQAHGGHVDDTFSWNERADTSGKITFAVSDSASTNNNEWSFPIDDRYYFTARNLNLLAIFDSINNRKIADISTDMRRKLFGDFFVAHRASPMSKLSVLDNKAQAFADQLKIPLIKVFGRYIPQLRQHYAISDAQGNYDSNIAPAHGYDYLGGWFKRGGTSGKNEPLTFHHCFSELRGGGYLFGTHDGKLAKADDRGNFEIVFDGLKNFRLRELKNISKAKK